MENPSWSGQILVPVRPRRQPRAHLFEGAVKLDADPPTWNHPSMAKAKKKKAIPPTRTANEFLVVLRKRVAGPRGMKRFSKMCGIPYTTYRNYELGRNRVPFLAAKAIAAATGEDPYHIMAGEKTPEEAPRKEAPAPRETVLHARGRIKLESFRDRDLRERLPVAVTAEEYGKGDDFLKGGNRIALVAKGQSMAPTILPGDLLVFATGRKAAQGDIVMVSVGKEKQVRRHFRDAARKIVFLHSEGTQQAPAAFREGKPEWKKLRVEGVLVSLRRSRFR